MPDGWCWLFSPDDAAMRRAVYASFVRGDMDRARVALVDTDTGTAWIGSYAEGVLVVS